MHFLSSHHSFIIPSLNMTSTHLFSCLFTSLFISSLPGSISANKPLDFDTLDGSIISWADLYTKYVSKSRPVILQNALDNIASRQWSSDYIYHHPGAALTFRNLTKKSTASIRTIVEQREYFMQLKFRLPLFLRPDLTLPKCLDCDQLIDRMDSPLWLWHFQKTKVKLHEEKHHQIWCMVKGTVQMTILPKWSDGMMDHFLTDMDLSQAPVYKDTDHFGVTLDKGHCFYVPADTLRQWQPVEDTMAIIFRVDNSILNEREGQFQRCRSLGGSLEKIRFADDDRPEEGAIENVRVLQRIVSYLGHDNCLDKAQFKSALRTDTSIRPLEGSPSLDTTSKDLFAALDIDQDEEFCWSDIDLLTLDRAIELTSLVNSRLSLAEPDEKTTKNERKHDIDEL